MQCTHICKREPKCARDAIIFVLQLRFGLARASVLVWALSQSTPSICIYLIFFFLFSRFSLSFSLHPLDIDGWCRSVVLMGWEWHTSLLHEMNRKLKQKNKLFNLSFGLIVCSFECECLSVSECVNDDVTNPFHLRFKKNKIEIWRIVCRSSSRFIFYFKKIVILHSKSDLCKFSLSDQIEFRRIWWEIASRCSAFTSTGSLSLILGPFSINANTISM